MKITIKKRIFNNVYYKHLKNNKRYQLFFGGSSSGKSYFLAQRCIIDILNGERNYLICRNTANAIRKSVFNEICKAITFFKANELFKINKSDMIITCANGYQIMFVGLDDTEKVKSTTPMKGVFTDIWVNKSAHLKPS